MNIEIWGWDEVVLPLISQWRKILVDTAGHLQVDVLTSGLPALAATAANQVLINANLTTIAGFNDYMTDNMGLQIRGRIGATIGPAAGSTNALLRLIEADTGSIEAALGQCYGWVGDVWYHLLVESAGDPNLRVKLFDGATGITSYTLGGLTYDSDDAQSLVASGYIWLWSSVGEMKTVVNAKGIGDGSSGEYHQAVSLIGYNGATWDRLRSYGTGILKVAKGAISPTRIRMTATGRVGVAGAKTLFWIACSPADPNAEWQITDADAGGGTVVYDHFDTDKHSDHLDFDPPMEFATGIWVEKFDHMFSLVFCYI